MKTTLERTLAVLLHTIVFVLTTAFAASGQSTKISGTLRHGSGLLDIPVASNPEPCRNVPGVLAHIWQGE